jgi:hypothetical protein
VSECRTNIWPSIGAENPIPEEVNHPKIAVRVAVMNEVQFLFPSEPSKSLKSRSLDVVFNVEEDVRIERRSARDYQNYKQINWQQEICNASNQKDRNKEERRVITLLTEVCL